MKPPSLLLTPPTPPGVSLPGLIAASARINVLGNVKSTLRSIGLSPARPGCISITVAGREEALAARLGCSPSIIHAASSPPVDPADGLVLRWGDGEIRRTYLNTRARRISPTALSMSSHHRAAWLNGLLDYCPESLELLIDGCARCGRTQGWLAAEGIDRCDEPGCGPLQGVAEHLPESLIEGYRRFAGICSPIPTERRTARSGLSSELADLPPVNLVDFAMKIGLALEDVVASGHGRFKDLSSGERSRAASRGAMALGEWPLRLRSEIRTELTSRGIADGAARRRLHAGLLSAGRSIRGGAQLQAVVSKALPEIHVEVGRSFVGLHGPRLLASVASRRLGISHARLGQLSQAGVFTEEGVVTRNHRRVLYDAECIDVAADAWRGSAPVENLMRRLGLPRYACERIVGAGDVENATHPFVLGLAGQPRFVIVSLENYASRIRAACRTGPAPADAVRIESAMRMVGGRLKPWCQVLRAVGRSRLPAWQTGGDGPLSATLLVRLDELEFFAAADAADGVATHSFLSNRLSQYDAMTVLNLNQITGPHLAAAGLLRFETGRKSLLVEMDDVLAIARDHVSVAEAAARLRQQPNAVRRRVVRELGQPASPAGWLRSVFDQRFAGERMA